MAGRSFAFYLLIISLAGAALLVFKLLRTGLYRRYRIFFLYLLFRIANSIVSLSLDITSDDYFYVWSISEPVIWAFYILVVRELVGLVLEKHTGLGTLGRWFMYTAMVISAAVSVFSILPKITPQIKPASQRLFYVFAIDRGITLSLVIFLLLLLFFLSRYPVPLGRNVLVHAALYTLFFLSSTLTTLLKSVFGSANMFITIDTVLVGFAAACMFAWYFLLSPKGEEVKMSIPHFSAEQEERILYKLDTLNATLLKVGGK